MHVDPASVDADIWGSAERRRQPTKPSRVCLKAHAAEKGVGSPAASPKSADYLLPVQQLLRQLARPWLADAVHIGFCVGEPRLVAAAGQAAADSHMQVSAAH